MVASDNENNNYVEKNVSMKDLSNFVGNNARRRWAQTGCSFAIQCPVVAGIGFNSSKVATVAIATTGTRRVEVYVD